GRHYLRPDRARRPEVVERRHCAYRGRCHHRAGGRPGGHDAGIVRRGRGVDAPDRVRSHAAGGRGQRAGCSDARCPGLPDPPRGFRHRWWTGRDRRVHLRGQGGRLVYQRPALVAGWLPRHHRGWARQRVGAVGRWSHRGRHPNGVRLLLGSRDVGLCHVRAGVPLLPHPTQGHLPGEGPDMSVDQRSRTPQVSPPAAAPGRGRRTLRALLEPGATLVIAFLAIAYAGQAMYTQDYVVLICTYALLALGMYVPYIMSGGLSLAYNAYLGLGAYSCALISTHTDLSSMWGVPIGAVASAFVATILGMATSKLSGFYLAGVTLLFG